MGESRVRSFCAICNVPFLVLHCLLLKQGLPPERLWVGRNAVHLSEYGLTVGAVYDRTVLRLSSTFSGLRRKTRGHRKCDKIPKTFGSRTASALESAAEFSE